MVDVSTLENMFEKFSTQIATNVKQIGTKLDLHIKAASVAQAATDKKLEEHDKRIKGLMRARYRCAGHALVTLDHLLTVAARPRPTP